MSGMDHEQSRRLKLPVLIVGTSDVTRLRREVEALNDYLHEAGLRKVQSTSLPKLSRLLESMAQENDLNLLTEADRNFLQAFLEKLLKSAPMVRISFAVDPSSAFMSKIVTWFRTNIDPNTLVQIGLQPTIAAGCVVRTSNHYYDLSLRKFFAQHADLLVKKMEAN
jgi:F0F1-type ATP synthase delta subunit